MSTCIDAMVILLVLLKFSLRNGCNEGYGKKVKQHLFEREHFKIKIG